MPRIIPTVIGRLRRLRWLAAMLLAASPAGLGQALPLLHPCPVDAPWVVAAHAGTSGMGHHGAHQPGHSATHHECTCIGQCSTPAIASPPQDVIAAVSIVSPLHTEWPLIEAVDPRTTLVDRLPEKTAPPIS